MTLSLIGKFGTPRRFADHPAVHNGDSGIVDRLVNDMHFQTCMQLLPGIMSAELQEVFPVAVLITDETIAALGMSDETLRQELALILFRDGKLTLARAARFAELPRLLFQKLLASRQIPMNYDVEDFERDLATLKDAGEL